MAHHADLDVESDAFDEFFSESSANTGAETPTDLSATPERPDVPSARASVLVPKAGRRTGRLTILASVAAVALVGMVLIYTPGLTNGGDATPETSPPLGSAAPAAPIVPSHPQNNTGALSRSVPAQIAAAQPMPVVLPADIGNMTAYSPSFNASGTSLFFHAGRGPTTSLLQASLGDDGELVTVQTLVRDGASNFHIQVSPDGSRIAFDSDRDGERGVYVANPDGSAARRISGSGYAAIPSWSPDGSRLAFVRAEPLRPKVWNIWTADLATNDLERETSHSVGQPWGGSWFPDGRHLAYSHEDRLVIVDLETKAERVFRSPVHRRLVRTPAVSPDGRQIVFQVYRNGTWMLNVADGSLRRLLTDQSAEEFAWTPDGGAVAYHSRRSGQWGIWMVRV